MANTEVVAIVIDTIQETVQYLLPIIGVLAGANFVVGWLMSILFGKHTGLRG